MPELPEVETLRLGLQKYLVGKKIVDVEVRDPKLFEGDQKDIIGAKITGVRRLAKGILIDLDNGYTIAVHIKLTGQLIFRDSATQNLLVQKPTPSKVPNKFTRVIFKLKSQSANRKTTTQNSKLKEDAYLYFNDVRRFAWMKVIPTDQVSKLEFFKSLGPEPFVGQTSSGQAKLTPKYFQEIVNKSNLPIKVLLMDQKKIGGIGNIYANEACFDACIDPRRRAKTLKPDEIKKIYKSIFKVLELGLKYRGSSELNFVDVLGQVGEYQKHVKTYGQKGKKCSRCSGNIQKIYLGGRGTYYCEKCQK